MDAAMESNLLDRSLRMRSSTTRQETIDNGTPRVNTVAAITSRIEISTRLLIAAAACTQSVSNRKPTPRTVEIR